ncbi:HEAT repeat domain-containing protein [Aquisphaera insulae]|uniref:HEAT repeat domain-containing protein n=1 Tax=Aquisphaera insulae TaxID=2712864 RepID=UPI0013EA1726|nr:HEAT repeat domain-containing protein [Aquisphaera insulae]
MRGNLQNSPGRPGRGLPEGRHSAPGRRRPRSAAPLLLLAILAPAAAVLSVAPAAPAQPPGPELFAMDPRNPRELWAAVDYLVETGQAAKAVPYLERFSKAEVSDEVLAEIREKYGIRSILRLADDRSTARFAEPLVNRFSEASYRHALQPDRVAALAAELTGTPLEQNYAVAGLREAGPYAVPAILEAMTKPGVSPEAHALYLKNLSRLDRSTVPALLAAVDAAEPSVAADAAEAIGKLGEPTAVPFLTYAAAAADTPPPVKEAARAAIARLTGKPFEAQPVAPTRVLTEAAWRYHRHQVEFPGDPVMVWGWDGGRKVPAPRAMKATDAERTFGLKLAGQAARLDPNDLDAKVVNQSLTLEAAVARAGFNDFPGKEQPVFDAAVKQGPAVLEEVLRKATADRKDDLAGAAAMALARNVQPGDLARNGRPHPLVDALVAPGRRTQLAAARAIVGMEPRGPFPGSSRLVPVLTRFISAEPPPRAVVIDTNPNRGSQVAGALRGLGYEVSLGLDGSEGFLAAVEAADTELVFVAHALEGNHTWTLTDVLTNLKRDARTANLPVYIYGPLHLDVERPSLPQNFPGVKFIVQPVSSAILEQLLKGRPSRLTPEDRSRYTVEAAALLAKLAGRPDGPFAADLATAGPPLIFALGVPATSESAAAALADVPTTAAQRSLADAAIDVARPPALRSKAAGSLAHSIARFGPLVSGDQEIQLAADATAEPDAATREAIASAVSALRARAAGNTRTKAKAPAPDPRLPAR